MSYAIHKWEIPLPAEVRLREFFDLGWYRLETINGPILKWPFPRGTPQFPPKPMEGGEYMSGYEFSTDCIPGVIVKNDCCARISFTLSSGETWVTNWGGLMDADIAKHLRPWARPVKLEFTAYRVGRYDWQTLEKGEWLWGCLLRGSKLQETVVFAVLKNQWPMIANRKSMIFKSPEVLLDAPPGSEHY